MLYCATTESCTSACACSSHIYSGCFDLASLSSHSNVLYIQIIAFHLHKHFSSLHKHLNYVKIAVIFTVEDG